MKWWTLSVIALLASAAGGQAPAESTAPSTAAARELAQCLVADAAPGHVPDNPRAHLRKALVLTSFASRLAPANAEAWRVRAEAFDVLGDFPAAAAAEAEHLALLGGRGYESGTRWIRYSLATLDTAELRLAMLKGLADDTGRTKPLRALALVNLAAITEGRGQLDDAAALYRRSLELDPVQDTALRSLARLSKEPSAIARVRLASGQLQGNPLAVNVAWEVGQICRDLGLYDEAMTMYDYALAVAAKSAQTPSDVFTHDMLDCLLDAGRYERALDQYTEVIAEGVTDLPIAGMLVEAARASGDAEKTKSHMTLMREAYRPLEAIADTKAEIAAEVAWFHLHYRHRLRVAEDWAAIAYRAAPGDPFVQRVWAFTHLRSAEADEARAVLSSLRDDDLYALVGLIDDAFARGDTDETKAFLAEIVAFGRRGPAWRYLLEVLTRHGAALPDPPAESQPVAAAVAELASHPILKMGQAPEAFIAVTVVPVAAEVAPGRWPAVVVTLSNISKAPVPLGSWGLFTPKLTLSVTVDIPAEGRQVTGQIPVVWETPRMLAPGESLSRTVKLNQGRLGEAMAYRPLSTLALTVEALADPVLRDEKWVSGMPSIAVEPARMTRLPLVASPQTPDAYYKALVALVASFSGKDDVEAMRAAEVTVSLLVLTQKVRAGETAPAGKLGRGLREGELLRMLQYCLQETSPIVRARTLGAMRRLKPTPLMLQLIDPCVTHSSPLVRARAVEVLAAAGTDASKRALVLLAEQDPDPLVRDMAKAVAPAAKPQP